MPMSRDEAQKIYFYSKFFDITILPIGNPLSQFVALNGSKENKSRVKYAMVLLLNHICTGAEHAGSKRAFLYFVEATKALDFTDEVLGIMSGDGPLLIRGIKHLRMCPSYRIKNCFGAG